MNGHILKGTSIAVDYWKVKLSPRTLVHFLTHLHGDHIVGLTSSWARPIHCSEITASLLERRYGVCRHLIKVLPLNKEKLVTSRSGTFTVVMLEANHCPGAVMFYFQGSFGRILYTGDFRSSEELIVSCVPVAKNVDVLYLDNTFCEDKCIFPPRSHCLAEILNIIRKHPNHKIIIGIRKLGKETMLGELGSQLNETIVVPPMCYNLCCDLFDTNVFTTPYCVKQSRIWAMPMNRINGGTVAALKKKIENTIVILPTAVFTGQDIHPFSYTSDIYVVPYSDHSNYTELQEFVSAIRPRCVKPIVEKGGFRDPQNRRADMSCFNKFLSNDPSSRRSHFQDNRSSALLTNQPSEGTIIEVVNAVTDPVLVELASRSRKPVFHCDSASTTAISRNLSELRLATYLSPLLMGKAHKQLRKLKKCRIKARKRTKGVVYCEEDGVNSADLTQSDLSLPNMGKQSLSHLIIEGDDGEPGDSYRGSSVQAGLESAAACDKAGPVPARHGVKKGVNSLHKSVSPPKTSDGDSSPSSGHGHIAATSAATSVVSPEGIALCAKAATIPPGIGDDIYTSTQVLESPYDYETATHSSGRPWTRWHDWCEVGKLDKSKPEQRRISLRLRSASANSNSNLCTPKSEHMSIDCYEIQQDDKSFHSKHGNSACQKSFCGRNVIVDKSKRFQSTYIQFSREGARIQPGALRKEGEGEAEMNTTEDTESHDIQKKECDVFGTESHDIIIKKEWDAMGTESEDVQKRESDVMTTESDDVCKKEFHFMDTESDYVEKKELDVTGTESDDVQKRECDVTDTDCHGMSEKECDIMGTESDDIRKKECPVAETDTYVLTVTNGEHNIFATEDHGVSYKEYLVEKPEYHDVSTKGHVVGSRSRGVSSKGHVVIDSRSCYVSIKRHVADSRSRDVSSKRHVVVDSRSCDVSSKGHVVDSRSRDVSSKGHVVDSRSCDVSSKGHVADSRSRDVSSKGHVVVGSRSRDVSSKGHVVDSQSRDVSSKGHVVDSRSRDVSSKGHVVDSRSHDVSSKGHVVDSQSCDVSSKGHVVDSRSRDVSSKGHVVDSRSRDVSSKGHVVDSQSCDVSSKGHVVDSRSRDVSSKGHVVDSRSRDVSSKGHVVDSRSRDVSSKGHVVDSRSHDVSSKGHVVDSQSRDVSSKGHVVDSRSRDVSSKGHVVDSRSRDVSSKGHVVDSRSRDVSSKGHVVDSRSRDVSSKGHVVDSQSCDVSSKGHVVDSRSRDVSSKGHVVIDSRSCYVSIKRHFADSQSRDVSSKRRVVVDSQSRDVSSKGHVVDSRSRDVSSKGHVVDSRSCDVSSKGHVVADSRSRDVSSKGHVVVDTCSQSRNVSSKGHVVVDSQSCDVSSKEHVVNSWSSDVSSKGHVVVGSPGVSRDERCVTEVETVCIQENGVKEAQTPDLSSKKCHTGLRKGHLRARNDYCTGTEVGKVPDENTNDHDESTTVNLSDPGVCTRSRHTCCCSLRKKVSSSPGMCSHTCVQHINRSGAAINKMSKVLHRPGDVSTSISLSHVASHKTSEVLHSLRDDSTFIYGSRAASNKMSEILHGPRDTSTTRGMKEFPVDSRSSRLQSSNFPQAADSDTFMNGITEHCLLSPERQEFLAALQSFLSNVTNRKRKLLEPEYHWDF